MENRHFLKFRKLPMLRQKSSYNFRVVIDGVDNPRVGRVVRYVRINSVLFADVKFPGTGRMVRFLSSDLKEV